MFMLAKFFASSDSTLHGLFLLYSFCQGTFSCLCWYSCVYCQIPHHLVEKMSIGLKLEFLSSSDKFNHILYHDMFDLNKLALKQNFGQVVESTT